MKPSRESLVELHQSRERSDGMAENRQDAHFTNRLRRHIASRLEQCGQQNLGQWNAQTIVIRIDRRVILVTKPLLLVADQSTNPRATGRKRLSGHIHCYAIELHLRLKAIKVKGVKVRDSY